MGLTSEEIGHFVQSQLSCWPLARKNFKALKKADYRTLEVGGLDVKVQFNPSRAISTKAETDPASIAARPCFLCLEHRPAEQKHLPFEGAKGKRYRFQLNPYPITQNHFVVASDTHTPQSIWHRIVDMLRLSKRQQDFTFLYNGPKAGASVPDHFHFQAIPSGELPLEADIRAGAPLEYICPLREATLWRYPKFANGIFVIRGITSKSVAKLFYRLLDCCPLQDGDSEPRFNLYSWYDGRLYTVVVVLRTTHRSEHYYSPDPSRRLCMSPGCVDMGGMFVTVLREDFDKLTPGLLAEAVRGVTISDETQSTVIKRLTRTQKALEIEIARASVMEFELVSDGAGKRCARAVDGRIEYGGVLYDEIFFEAKTSSTMFATRSFVIHRGESQTPYPGSLRIEVCGEELRAVNILGVEDCLLCLVSGCGSEALRSRVISLRARLTMLANACAVSAESIDYHGVSPELDPLAREAVDSTWGSLE